MLSHHNAVTRKIDSKQISCQHTNSWRLNSSLLNAGWAEEEIKKETKIFQGQMTMKNTAQENFWDTLRARTFIA